MAGFYEDDEDPREVLAAFDAGEKIVSARPVGVPVKAWTGVITGCRTTA